MFSVMAGARLTSSSSTLLCKTRTTQCINPSSLPSSLGFPYPTISCFLASSSISISHTHDPFASSLLVSTSKTRVFRVLAVIEEQPVAVSTPGEEEEEEEEDDETGSPQESKVRVRPCELYVCNLPRSYEISELLEMLKPHGTIQSVEISRNPETGLSRGSGYVTMSSVDEAKAAISALDGSDVGGREMRVRFSSDMNSKNSGPKKNMVFESPHKVYVGNLAWSVKPEDLRDHFSQFGTVVSTRVLYDRKTGVNRVYGFISFSSDAEREAALSSSGTEFRGRTLLVREVSRKSESS